MINEERICHRFAITDGDEDLWVVRIPIVDWSGWGVLRTQVNRKLTEFLWADVPAVHRALASAPISDAHRFKVRREIARIERESQEKLERQLAGFPRRTVEKLPCPVIHLPVRGSRGGAR